MKSLANPNRFMIACALIDGERSVGDLETDLGLRQPSLSQQLAELRESGVVEARREAKQVFYRISDQRVVALLATLDQIFCGEMPDFAPAVTAPREVPTEGLLRRLQRGLKFLPRTGHMLTTTRSR
jgi:DNA-binding transcriptional ArsR family regulator